MPHRQKRKARTLFFAVTNLDGIVLQYAVTEDTDIKISKSYNLLSNIPRTQWEELLKVLNANGATTEHSLQWFQDDQKSWLTIDCRLIDKKIYLSCTAVNPQNFSDADGIAYYWFTRLRGFKQWEAFSLWLMRCDDPETILSLDRWLRLLEEYELSAVEIDRCGVLHAYCSSKYQASQARRNWSLLCCKKISVLRVYLGGNAYGSPKPLPPKICADSATNRTSPIMTNITKPDISFQQSRWVRENENIWKALPVITIVYDLTSRDQGYRVLASKANPIARLNAASLPGGRITDLPDSIALPRMRAIESLIETGENQHFDWSYPDWTDPLTHVRLSDNLAGEFAISSDRQEGILMVTDTGPGMLQQIAYWNMVRPVES